MTREEAIKVLKSIKTFYIDIPIGEDFRTAIDLAIESLSADKVEVVRCKDCRWYLNNHLCKQLSRFGSIEPLADFYCAFGERREP